MTLRLPTRLELLAFICGFTLMTYELAAARVLAPTVGSSTYVWTSVIGVIIAALSLGFYLGGQIADARNTRTDVAWLLLLVAGLIALTTVLYPYTLPWIANWGVDVRLQAVGAAILLFTPTSFALGMISPYLAKLNVTSLKTSGTAVAKLSMWDALGGISGTFLTGFFLFGYIGSRAIFVVLVVIVLLSIALLGVRLGARQWGIAGVSLLVVVATPAYSQALDIDTPSAHYTIFEWEGVKGLYRGLSTGPSGIQSGVALDDPYTPVFWYTEELYDLVGQTKHRERILILGGGTFTLPQQLALAHPDSQIDVVEIDPGLMKIAREHFYYEDHDNVDVIFEDARTFVNRTTTRYDIVIVDAYGDADIPFTFMTQEYGKELQEVTKSEGLVMVNFIAAREDGCEVYLSALEAPYRANFSQRLLKHNATTGQEKRMPHNIIAIYSHQEVMFEGYEQPQVATISPYTDDFVPAERLRQKCI